MRPFIDPILYFIPVFIITLIIEYRIIEKSKVYPLHDAFTSIGMGLGNLLFSLIWAPVIWSSTVWFYQHRLFDFKISFWTYILLIFFDDFIYYWFHRLSHEVRLWWAAHVNHHSSEEYNLSTALRQHWTGSFVGNWLLWLPLAWIGFDPRYILLQKSISLLYQYWIHTEIIQKMPNWFEKIFNTPSHHRVHHASNTMYLDCNYAGIFIIWDKLFKTFIAENPLHPVKYGLTTNIKTFNLFHVAFHEWKNIFKDIKDPQKQKYILMYLFAPPGWSHDNSTLTAKQMQKKKLNF